MVPAGSVLCRAYRTEFLNSVSWSPAAVCDGPVLPPSCPNDAHGPHDAAAPRTAADTRSRGIDHQRRGTSILGLVQHLAEAERYWFGHHLAGAACVAGREYGMTVSASRAADDVLRDYRAAIEDSDRAIRDVGDPEARFVVPVDGNRHTLRWVMVHMTSETARHAGHADILREQLDGTTGR
jgi:hypothetical protein